MGNNGAYTTWEEQVMTLYEKGVLTLAVLDAISEVFRDTDIDSGGSQDLIARDGKDVIEVCMALIEPELQARDPQGYWNWDVYDRFSEIRLTRWGWS